MITVPPTDDSAKHGIKIKAPGMPAGLWLHPKDDETDGTRKPAVTVDPDAAWKGSFALASIKLAIVSPKFPDAVLLVERIQSDPPEMEIYEPKSVVFSTEPGFQQRRHGQMMSEHPPLVDATVRFHGPKADGGVMYSIDTIVHADGPSEDDLDHWLAFQFRAIADGMDPRD